MKQPIRLLVLAALAATVAGTAIAADTTGATTEDTKGHGVYSGEILVTASRTQELLKTEPQSAEVITAKDIQRMGADNVLSALALADNLNLSKAGMTGNSVQLRGMSTNHTLILVDGKRIAGEDASNTTNVYALQRLNVSDIDRIEIVRGPSSSLYGSDAMGGVINVITRVPKKAGGTFGVSTGTLSTSEYGNFDFGKHGRWSTSIDARLERRRPFNRFGHSEAINPMTHAVSSITDGYTRSMYGMRKLIHLASQYDFENANKNKLRFDIDYGKENFRSDFPDTKSRIFTGSMPPVAWRLTNKNKKEWYDNESRGFSVEYSGKTKKNDYKFRTYYNDLEKYSHLLNERILPSGPIMTPAGTPANYDLQYPKEDMDRAKYSTWVTEAQNTTYIGDSHNLTYGGEFRRVKYAGTRLGDSLSGMNKIIKSHKVDSYAAYVQDQWQVNDKLYIIPSLRFEHSSQFGSEVTPKVGLTYNFNNFWRFKANYGLGYKAPTITELYMRMHRAMGPMTVNIYGNPELDPEKSKSFDFSVEADKGAWFGKVTYFNNKVTNLITTERFTGPTGPSDYRYVNVDDAQINGIEAEVGRRIGKRWITKITHNWLDAIDKKKHTQLDNRAKNTTTFQLIYDDKDKIHGFSAVLWDQFASDYHYDGKMYTYNTVNFSFNKKLNEAFSVYGGVDNIFNKKIDAIYIDGRMWRVGAEWKW